MTEKFCVHYFTTSFGPRNVLLRKEKTRVLSRHSTKTGGSFEVWSTPAVRGSDGKDVWTKAHRAEVPCPPGWS
jgi:hypothetical protein